LARLSHISKLFTTAIPPDRCSEYWKMVGDKAILAGCPLRDPAKLQVPMDR